MCSGGASSQRLTYEVNLLKLQRALLLNDVDEDFYDILTTVKIINFTGGETLLQTQVHNLINYLIEQNLAKNISISLLTNASSYPTELIEKFKKFRNVVYTISVDGVGNVIEYQRRGAKWTTVEENCLKIVNTQNVSAVINYVLTAVNIFSFMDFIDWAHETNLVNTNKIYLSPVFRTEHLGQASLDQSQRKIILHRLNQGRTKYLSLSPKSVELIDQVDNIINTTPFNAHYQNEFIKYIKDEDTVSKKSLAEVVPEWASYF
jgi:MoaA/NifB/PqqE/SkfB family radical SAM enzyme